MTFADFSLVFAKLSLNNIAILIGCRGSPNFQLIHRGPFSIANGGGNFRFTVGYIIKPIILDSSVCSLPSLRLGKGKLLLRQRAVQRIDQYPFGIHQLGVGIKGLSMFRTGWHRLVIFICLLLYRTNKIHHWVYYRTSKRFTILQICTYLQSF